MSTLRDEIRRIARVADQRRVGDTPPATILADVLRELYEVTVDADVVPTADVRAVADELSVRLDDENRDRQAACEWAMYELYDLAGVTLETVEVTAARTRGGGFESSAAELDFAESERCPHCGRMCASGSLEEHVTRCDTPLGRLLKP